MASLTEKVEKAIEILRAKVYEELPLRQILLFLKVANLEEKSPTGVNTIDLLNLTGMPQGSLSRNISELCVYLKDDPKRPGHKIKAGHDLLEKRPDMYNQKSLSITLSKKGKEILKEIEQMN